MRAQVVVQGWLLDVAPGPSMAPLGSHELTHVVQQRNDMRAWQSRMSHGQAVSGWDAKTTSPTAHALPEVGDEILVAFEHGDARNVTIYFNPTEMKISKPTPWKVELGSIARSALRIVVRQRGSGPLSIAVRSTVAAGVVRTERWTSIL